MSIQAIDSTTTYCALFIIHDRVKNSFIAVKKNGLNGCTEIFHALEVYLLKVVLDVVPNE
jgi:hypothetical protein